MSLLFPVSNAPAGQIIGREFDGYTVSGQDSNIEFAHFPGYVSKNDMVIVQLHTEHGIWKRLNYRSFDFNCFFLGQRCLLNM